jgi:hypothetical protein
MAMAPMKIDLGRLQFSDALAHFLNFIQKLLFGLVLGRHAAAPFVMNVTMNDG